MNDEIATGFFLRLKDAGEEKDFREFLIDGGYTPDSLGLRNFVLDCIYEEEPKESESPILNVFTQNPEAVKTGLDFVSKKISEKLFGTKKPS